MVNALYLWAVNSADRIAQLTAERDAIVAVILSGGTDRRALTSGTINGKAFTALVSLAIEDKLAVLTSALTALGETPTPIPRVTFGAFPLER